MPEKRTIQKARTAKRAGKAPTTQAGEFVRGEVHRIRHGKHGARSPQQAVAIGLSKARRAGVDLPPPARGTARKRTRTAARYAYDAGHGRRKPQRRPRVARAVTKALKREPRSSVSHAALSRHARSAASRRSPAQRSAAAHKAVRTRKAVRTTVRTRSTASVRHPAGHRKIRHTTTRHTTTTRHRHTSTRHTTTRHNPVMIRKLQSGGYRLYSRHVDPRTRKRHNLGTFSTRRDAERHQRAAQQHYAKAG